MVVGVVAALGVASLSAARGQAMVAGETALELQLGDNPSRGSERAPLVLIEFIDYRDPYCTQADQQILRWLEESHLARGEVRHVVMDFPIHRGGEDSARSAQCAHRQSRFWEFRRRLLAHGGVVPRALDDSDRVGLDRQELERCMSSEDVARAVEADGAEARRLGLPGVPSFVLAAPDPYRSGTTRVLATLPGARREPVQAAITRALADPPRFEPPQPLTLHAVALEPASVAVGERMALVWELTANDQDPAGDGEVEVSLSYAIIEDGKTLYRSEPRTIAVTAGKRIRTEALIPAKAAGTYSLVAFARVGAIEESSETSFEVQ